MTDRPKRNTRPHRPTEESRTLVRSLAAYGVRHEDIASRLGISQDTLVRKYRVELDHGRVDANAAVAQTLYQKARAGDTTACIFWLKTRAGWREKVDLNHSSDDRSMTPVTRIEIVPGQFDDTDKDPTEGS